MDADSHRQRPSLLIRAPRRFSRTEATRTRYPGSPAPPWPPPPPCAPVLPLTLFSQCLRGSVVNILLVAASAGRPREPCASVASATSVCSRFAFDFVFLSVSVAL